VAKKFPALPEVPSSPGSPDARLASCSVFCAVPCSDRFPPAANPTPRPRFLSVPSQQKETETCPLPTASLGVIREGDFVASRRGCLVVNGEDLIHFLWSNLLCDGCGLGEDCEGEGEDGKSHRATFAGPSLESKASNNRNGIRAATNGLRDRKTIRSLRSVIAASHTPL
jgi:hypothetical protein